MTNNKTSPNSEKEEIRLQLMASMLAGANTNLSRKSRGSWRNFWQELFSGRNSFH